ncbi:YheC/YheD family endospore coat-associated protein [Calidifontibacillus oryziterrae]|uniref:YheC/YheD family endospore coat-associated protein n=1 Tax=Calidifontibacillus oryziterrae TaxID=1191699 RepID=UPI0002DCF3AC|nr:YheC/YheD family protein [Calidifontibacillus oryziterrae]
MKKRNKEISIVGILTSEGKNSPITGNFTLFRELSKRLTSIGGKVILLTPASLCNGKLNYGYVFKEDKNKWLYTTTIPRPTIIYNRIPYRKDEKTESFQAFSAWCNQQSIPFFNQSFLSKWDVYNTFSQEPTLQQYLPETELITTKEQLHQLLKRHNSLYLKPCEGSKGNGIYVLSKLKNETYLLRAYEKAYGSSSFTKLWKDKIQPLILNRDYLAQRHIELEEQNNRSFDFRLLTHLLNNEWVISGMGIRQRKKNGITTHVLKGGNILKLDEIATSVDKTRLQEIISSCGVTLSSKYQNLKEFSVDIGKSVSGHYYIFDINAKPMKFDEIDIYESGIKNLMQIFTEHVKVDTKV